MRTQSPTRGKNGLRTVPSYQLSKPKHGNDAEYDGPQALGPVAEADNRRLNSNPENEDHAIEGGQGGCSIVLLGLHKRAYEVRWRNDEQEEKAWYPVITEGRTIEPLPLESQRFPARLTSESLARSDSAQTHNQVQCHQKHAYQVAFPTSLAIPGHALRHWSRLSVIAAIFLVRNVREEPPGLSAPHPEAG
jgi:hypothetical protein